MAPRLPSTPKASRKGTLHLASSNGANTPNPRAVAGDNSAAIEEADRVQFISILSRLSMADQAIETAMGPVRAARKARSQIVGLGKAAGFSAKELERRLEEMSMGTREMAAMAQREHKQRRWGGILDAEQAELILGNKAPEEKKDEAHWAGEGYKAGLRQMSNTPPTECPTRHHQAYMKAHERGHLEVLTANAPKRSAPAPDPAADYAADNPDIDVAAAARKLKSDPKFMDRSAPAEPAEGEMAAGVIHEPGTNGLDSQPGELVDHDPLGVNDGFEATPEELAGQIGRPQPDADVV